MTEASIWQDIFMFFLFMFLIFFGYSLLKSLFFRLMPSNLMIKDNMRDFSTNADNNLTPEMIGYRAIAEGKAGMKP